MNKMEDYLPYRCHCIKHLLLYFVRAFSYSTFTTDGAICNCTPLDSTNILILCPLFEKKNQFGSTSKIPVTEEFSFFYL
jgi:hypothetical protein